MEAGLSEFKGASQGVLRIGASYMPGAYLLPHALGRFAQLFPRVMTSLRISDTDGILSLLHAGDVDCAVVENEPSASSIHGWHKTEFWRDELVLIPSNIPGPREAVLSSRSYAISPSYFAKGVRRPANSFWIDSRRPGCRRIAS